MNRDTNDAIKNLIIAKLQYGLDNTDTIMDVLYQHYSERQRGDSPWVSEQFRFLNDVLCALSIRQQDQVVDITCRLCGAYQKEAYKDGVLAGFQLYRELSHDTQ